MSASLVGSEMCIRDRRAAIAAGAVRAGTSAAASRLATGRGQALVHSSGAMVKQRACAGARAMPRSSP
eukprot:8867112-Alexandrium_andersonii.AAC.1